MGKTYKEKYNTDPEFRRKHKERVKIWNVSESIYVGEWKNGYMHGKGILRRNDGEIYIGNYKQNNKNEYGTILYSDGKVDKGIWEDDKLIKSN